MAVAFDVPYSPREAAARLAPFVARSTTSPPVEDCPLRGAVSERGFRLAAVTRYQSSFAAWSEGTFTPTPGGCRIEYRTGTSAWSFLFLVLWFGVLIAIAYQRLGPPSGWPELLPRDPEARHLGLMLGGGVLIAGFGYALAWNEAQSIEATLRRALRPGAPAPDESRPTSASQPDHEHER